MVTTPFIPAAKCAKVAIEALWEGQKVVSTFWAEFGSEPSQSDLETLAAFFFTGYWAVIKSASATTYVIQRITATRQQNASDIQGVYTPSSGAAGTNGSDSLPNNAAWVLSGRTNLRGRSYRSRLYLPGLTSASLLNSVHFDPAVTGPIAAALATLLIDNLPSGWVWVVASHFADKAPRAAAVLTPILSIVADNAIDSMRRRLYGRGD
jgi:hypothetical protein